MTESLWHFLWHSLPSILIGFVAGGVSGVLVYSAIVAYLNRKPVIARRIDIVPKFEDLYGSSGLQSQITFSNGEKSYHYRHLHTVQVELTNQSKRDFDEFEFGITLASDTAIVYIEVQSPDRHRVVKSLTPLSFDQPRSQVDLSLQPFNREDTYTFRLLVTEPEDCLSPSNVTLSSPEAIRFVDLPNTEEMLKAAARSIAIPIGPFKISFR
jgi:hypothetical protein